MCTTRSKTLPDAIDAQSSSPRSPLTRRRTCSSSLPNEPPNDDDDNNEGADYDVFYQRLGMH
jgi:hypothetical protein